MGCTDAITHGPTLSWVCQPRLTQHGGNRRQLRAPSWPSALQAASGGRSTLLAKCRPACRSISIQTVSPPSRWVRLSDRSSYQVESPLGRSLVRGNPSCRSSRLPVTTQQTSASLHAIRRPLAFLSWLPPFLAPGLHAMPDFPRLSPVMRTHPQLAAGSCCVVATCLSLLSMPRRCLPAVPAPRRPPPRCSGTWRCCHSCPLGSGPWRWCSRQGRPSLCRQVRVRAAVFLLPAVRSRGTSPVPSDQRLAQSHPSPLMLSWLEVHPPAGYKPAPS